MKRFASLTFAAVMVLSLAGCGQQETSSVISDNSSVVSEPQDTTSATTTSATTTSATTSATTTTEATKASQPEEAPVASDPTAITGDITLSAASSITKGALVESYGDVVLMYSEADDVYCLADLNGEPVNGDAYSIVHNGFDSEGNAHVMLNGISCIINKQGEVLYENIEQFSDGILVTAEVTGQSEYFDVMINNYKYIFTDVETGEKIFSIDEMADAESPKNYSVMAMVNGYCVITRSQQAVAGLSGVYVLDREGNFTELYDFANTVPEIYGSGVYALNYDDNGYLFLCPMDKNSIIYDMHDGSYIEVKTEVDVSALTYSNREKGVFALEGYDTGIILDKDMNVLLDGLAVANVSGCDKYLLISDGDKWGYYDIESGEAVWYDDATNFHNGYAFVIEGGKGHFINENLEAVTDDIAATSAVHYDGLLYIADTDQLYPVNYPAAE